MNKKQYTKGVTPIGEAYFAHLAGTEKITISGNTKDTGKYSLLLKLSPKDHDKLLEQIHAEWEKFKDTLGNKRFKYDISDGTKEYKDEVFFKFSMNATINLKSGETISRTCPIFDTDCKEISKSVASILGNGSKVKVAFELVPFYMSDKNYGVSLRLTGVQLIELVEYTSSSASSLGFGQEEGFKASEEDTTEDLFDQVVEEEETTDGDF